MIPKPDETTLQAILHLRASSDFTKVLDWLSACLAKLDAESRKSFGIEMIYRQQGA